MIEIREFRESDKPELERIHDGARKIELRAAGLECAFLPLRIAAEREGLYSYPALYVAEEDGKTAGFAACTEDELAWLYVDPAHMRKGIGRRLSEYALEKFPNIRRIEVLKGNERAKKLYESLGFAVKETSGGRMPGNERFKVEVYIMERQ